MKKLISLLLVAGLMLSVFVMPASVFAADLDFLVAESYNNLPTGSAPEGAVSAGAAKVKVVEEEKQLNFPEQRLKAVFCIPLKPTKTLSVCFLK